MTDLFQPEAEMPDAKAVALASFMRRVEFDPMSGCWLWNGAMEKISGRIVCLGCFTMALCHPQKSKQDNIADMVAKGRQRSVPHWGSDSHFAKLNEWLVWEIRYLAASKLWTQARLAFDYDVSPMTVSRIVNWQSWPYVHMNWPLDPRSGLIRQAVAA